MQNNQQQDEIDELLETIEQAHMLRCKPIMTEQQSIQDNEERKQNQRGRKFFALSAPDKD